MSDEQGAGTGADTGQQQGQQGEPNGAPPEGQQQGQQQGNGPQQGAQSQQQGGQNDDAGKPATGDGDNEWKSRARQHEDRAKANKRAADEAAAERDKLATVLDGLRKALDPDGAGKSDDPAEIAARAVAEREQAAAELRLLKVERGAERAARKAGADVDALLDSRAFLARLEKLDPADAGFADDVAAAVDATLKDNPRLKAQQAAPPASPTGDMTGGGDKSGDRPLTIDERRAERRKRRGIG